jgi:hypothetical protein
MVTVGALSISLLAPPAFWLSMLGAVTLVGVITTNSARTEAWSYWPWTQDRSSVLTQKEKVAALGAIILMGIPLLVAIGRGVFL